MNFDAANIPPNLNDMARNLWSQLDSMAKNNPRGYKELMSKIEEEAKKTLIPVLPTIEPCFSIKLEGTIISGSKIHYINFCKCNAVEESTKDNDGGIPIVVREEDGKRKYRKYGKTFHVYDVSFNENIIKRAEADPFFKRNLIFMAINCVEQVFNISFKKDFTVTEEKYNGTFIHGHTSREGQPMPTLSQEEVNELLKNASTILNQPSDEKDKKDQKNKGKPIDMTPESILKEHKTYQEEMKKKNEEDDKINPEIESTIEKLFFSDEKKDDSKSSSKNNKIEEMTEVVPESKKTENISEEEDKGTEMNKTKNKSNNNDKKNQFIELEGNGVPKIIDLLNDSSSQKQNKQEENNAAISEAESKIFDFLKEFDDQPGNKITELDESNNEVPPSKAEELNVETPSKIEEIKEDTSTKIEELNVETPSKIEEIKEDTSTKIEELNVEAPSKIEEIKEDTSSKIEELNVETPSKIEEINEDTSTKIEQLNVETPSKIEELNDEMNKLKIDESSKIKEMKEEEETLNINESNETEELKDEKLHNKDTNTKINIEEINDKNKDDITPKIEEISHHQYLNENIDESETNPKIEEPTHTIPVVEEPPQNNTDSTNTEKSENNEEKFTPIVEEVTHENFVFSNIKEVDNNDNGSTPKIENITHDEELSLKENENDVVPKIEEPPHSNEVAPIVEEPVQNTEDAPTDENNTQNKTTPIIEEIIQKNSPISTFTDVKDEEKEKEEILPEKPNEFNDEVKSMNKSDETLTDQNENETETEKRQEESNDKMNDEKLEKKDEIQFKTIDLPEKEKPTYLLKTSEHYFYIKVKLPKLKLIQTLHWNLSNCEADEHRPETEKWLKVNSPEYYLHIRIDTEYLDSNHLYVSFAKSTKTLIFRFNRVLKE